MKLAELYSLGAGLKLNKPNLYTQFVPLFDNPYIVLHCGGGNGSFDSKIYSYYQEVINLIRPILIPLNYKIVQIGIEKDEQLQNIDLNLTGKTNIHQTNYIIQKAALFCGNDSFCSHAAGLFGTSMVCLYGGTSVINHSPYWHSDKSIFLESHRNGNKCSYSMVENPKTINLISPETVAQATLDLLGINQAINIKTLFIGSSYKDIKIELLPDQVIVPNFFNGIPTVRGDFFFNEANIIQQLALGKCVLTLAQPIDIEKLKVVKQNIALLLIKIDSFSDIVTYVKELRKNAINYSFVTSIQDDEELKSFKLMLYEYGIINKLPHIKKDSLDFVKELNYNKTRLKTNSLLLASSKTFASYAHYLANIPAESLQNTESPLLDNQAFFNDINNFWIYNVEN